MTTTSLAEFNYEAMIFHLILRCREMDGASSCRLSSGSCFHRNMECSLLNAHALAASTDQRSFS
jgi:hypothetical protein